MIAFMSLFVIRTSSIVIEKTYDKLSAVLLDYIVMMTR